MAEDLQAVFQILADETPDQGTAVSQIYVQIRSELDTDNAWSCRSAERYEPECIEE